MAYSKYSTRVFCPNNLNFFSSSISFRHVLSRLSRQSVLPHFHLLKFYYKMWLVKVAWYVLDKVIYIRLAIVACPDGKRSQYTSGFGKWLVERKVKRKFDCAEIRTWLIWVSIRSINSSATGTVMQIIWIWSIRLCWFLERVCATKASSSGKF